MQDNTVKGGEIISTEKYNELTRKWSESTRKLMLGNISTLTSKGKGDLLKSLRKREHLYYGEVRKITYRFDRHGVFFQKGVGRGYIVMNGKVVRGRKKTKQEIGSTKQTEGTTKITYSSGKLQREPKDWFNETIDSKMEQLADIVHEYMGDKAMLMASKMKIN